MIDLTFASLYATRDKVTALNASIATAVAAKQQVLQRRPHIDEVVQAFAGAIDGIVHVHEERLKTIALSPSFADVHAIDGVGALVALFRDEIVAAVPATLARISPGAAGGTTAADRRQALLASDGALRALQVQQEALRLELSGHAHTLREWLHEGGRNDWRTRGAIEREQATLYADMRELRDGEDRLAAAIGVTHA